MHKHESGHWLGAASRHFRASHGNFFRPPERNPRISLAERVSHTAVFRFSLFLLDGRSASSFEFLDILSSTIWLHGLANPALPANLDVLFFVSVHHAEGLEA